PRHPVGRRPLGSPLALCRLGRARRRGARHRLPRGARAAAAGCAGRPAPRRPGRPVGRDRRRLVPRPRLPRRGRSADRGARGPAAALEELLDAPPRELGATDWLTVDHDDVVRFGDVTRAHQWIHVDVERARRESPFGTTVVHGYLTLSLATWFVNELMAVD